MPEGVRFQSGEIEGQHAISPDGRKLVFAGGALGRKRLYLRPLDTLETQLLEGTDGGVSPFWSPDSRSIGLFSEGKLQRLDFAAVPPRTICDAPSLETLPSWGSTGKILFAQIATGNPGLYVVDAAGGTPQRIPYRGDPKKAAIWATFLPDGKRFLFLAKDFEEKGNRWSLMVGSLDSEKTTEITDTFWSRVEYAPPGYLVFASQGVLLAQRFDADAAKLSGEAVGLAERIYYFNGPAQAGFSVSDTGIVSYEKLAPPSRVAWVD